MLHAVYVKLLEGKLRFAGRSAFRTWLFGVVRLTASEHRRALGRRLALLSRWFADRPERYGAPASARAELSEDARRLRAALAGVSPRQREVLELVLDHDLSLPEAAEVLDLTLGSVKTHYDRGKRALRAALETER